MAEENVTTADARHSASTDRSKTHPAILALAWLVGRGIDAQRHVDTRFFQALGQTAHPTKQVDRGYPQGSRRWLGPQARARSGPRPDAPGR